jgi:hypothetical protein
VVNQVSIVRLQESSVHPPRRWRACRLASRLSNEQRLPEFWSQRRAPRHKGTRWETHKTALFTHLTQRWRDNCSMPPSRRYSPQKIEKQYGKGRWI